MRRFTEDHPIEMLHGTRRPSRGAALKFFARRVAWLSKRVEACPDRVRDPRASYYMEELAAIALAVEAIAQCARESVKEVETAEGAP